MIIAQLNLSWGGLGPLVVHVLLKLVIFKTKQKTPRQIFEWIFTAKNIARGNVSCFSHLGQVIYKIQLPNSRFKRVLDLISK